MDVSRIHRGVLVFMIIWALCVPIGLFWGLAILVPPLALNSTWHLGTILGLIGVWFVAIAVQRYFFFRYRVGLRKLELFLRLAGLKPEDIPKRRWSAAFIEGLFGPFFADWIARRCANRRTGL